jgi:hypothetical protein
MAPRRCPPFGKGFGQRCLISVLYRSQNWIVIRWPVVAETLSSLTHRGGPCSLEFAGHDRVFLLESLPVKWPPYGFQSKCKRILCS